MGRVHLNSNLCHATMYEVAGFLSEMGKSTRKSQDRARGDRQEARDLIICHMCGVRVRLTSSLQHKFA